MKDENMSYMNMQKNVCTKRKKGFSREIWAYTKIDDNATCGCLYFSKNMWESAKFVIQTYSKSRIYNVQVGTEVLLDMNCAIVSALLISLIW